MSVGHMWHRGDAVKGSFNGTAFEACRNLWERRVMSYGTLIVAGSFSLQLHHSR